MSRRLALAVLAATVVVLASGGGAAGQGRETPEKAVITDDAPLGRVERVLVYSVPTLAWKDLERVDAPNLERFLEESVVGNLSVRSVTRRTSAADGYATLNAGTRTEGTEQASLAFVAGLTRGSTDGDPSGVPSEVFEPEPPGDDAEPGPVLVPSPDEPDPTDPAALAPEAGERFDGSPAAEEFARRTGVQPQVGEVFNFGLVSMRAVNAKLLFGAEVGALGEALREAGVDRAVIANGDHGEGSDQVDYRREASVGLMDRNGLVAHGRVGRTLLRNDASAPFGIRYDNDEVAAAFGDFWGPDSVVLVEASDMVRHEDSVPLMLRSQQERQRDAAIARSDDLFGALLEQVDPERDAVVVLAPYAADESSAPTVVGVHAPGVEPGLLSSGTTRRAGFVQTVDIGPSILSLVGVEPPSSMEGTVMERAGSGGSHPDRVSFLVDSVAGAKFRDRLLGPATVVFVLAQLLLWVVAIWALSRSRRRLGLAAELGTLAVLVYLPVTFLAGAFAFHELGQLAWWCFVVGVSVALAGVIQALTHRYLVDPLLSALAVIVGVLSIDVVLGGSLQFNTVFGYTPTVAGRFDGIGNPAFSMLAAAGIIGAALIAHRLPGRRGVWTAIALLGWCVVLDGAPFLGADVGGALTLVPAAGVTAWMLLGWRVRLRTVAVGAVVTVGLVLAFGAVDLTRPAARQTHLGRLLTDIGDNGFGAFETVVLRKLNANLSVLMSSVWILMLPLVFAFIAFVVWWAPWRLRTIGERIPEERAAVAGLITAMLLGFVLNDSGISVPGLMLGVANASLINLLLRVDAGLPSSAADAAGDDEAAQVGGSQSVRT